MKKARVEFPGGCADVTEYSVDVGNLKTSFRSPPTRPETELIPWPSNVSSESHSMLDRESEGDELNQSRSSSANSQHHDLFVTEPVTILDEPFIVKKVFVIIIDLSIIVMIEIIYIYLNSLSQVMRGTMNIILPTTYQQLKILQMLTAAS